MKHLKSRKLVLNQETLRTLQSVELALVAGGVMNNTKSCNGGACGGTGTTGGGTGEDTVATCHDSYLACYY